MCNFLASQRTPEGSPPTKREGELHVIALKIEHLEKIKNTWITKYECIFKLTNYKFEE